MKTKLVILELISGLFGWAWIIASFAAVYFLVMAIGFEGKWSSFFWAVGAGIIAKWLARGFVENTMRIAEEDQANTFMDSENNQEADHRLEIISDFGDYLGSDPTGGDIRDVSELPHSKEDIFRAIFLQLAVAEDESRISALEVGAVMLADFQEGIGSEPLSLLGVPTERLVPLSENKEDILAMAKEIAENPNREKYETYRAIVDEDLVRIQEKLKAAGLSRKGFVEG